MLEFQQTIKATVSISGFGLHTGKKVSLTFQPAPVNHGFKFQRVDIADSPVVKADVDNVFSSARGTTISYNDVQIHTVEHVLAALVGLGVDNVLIELDNDEVPIMDGSAIQFMEAIESVGIETQDAEREYFPLNEVLHFYDEEKDAELIAIPSDEYQISTIIDYESNTLGIQHFVMNDISEFREKVASARTFCFLHELDYLVKNGLVKGGSLDNSVVFVEHTLEQESIDRLSNFFDVKNGVGIEVGSTLNGTKLRYDNEPARHKLLDIVGDLALVGTRVKARIMSTKPGHATNLEFAKKIKDYIKKNRHLLKVPKIDLNVPPVMDVEMIKKMLPHRYPFLLIDRIIKLTDDEVIGVKNVTYNEDFFQGHFPSAPIMPGVLQIEAMAQTGGILLLSTVDNPEDYLTYFLRIDSAKFRNKVVPGDTVIFKLNLISPIRRGICEMKAVAYVGEKIVTEAVLTAQIVKSSE